MGMTMACGPSPWRSPEGAAGDAPAPAVPEGHVRVFFEHYRELPALVRQEIRVKRDRYQSLIRNAITEGIRDGSFSTDPKGLTAP
jgi:Tetracyclin repressor-like, C-terminal domain